LAASTIVAVVGVGCVPAKDESAALGSRAPLPADRFLFRDPNGRYGYVDGSGRIVIPARFPWAKDFRGRWACVASEGAEQDRYHIIDTNGRNVKTFESRGTPVLWNGMVSIEDANRLHGFIPVEGKGGIPPRYAWAGFFNCSLAPALLPGAGERDAAGRRRIRFIDRSGKERFSVWSKICLRVSEGRVAVVRDRKWRYIDTQGNYVGTEGYDYARDFSEGLAAVKVNGRWGYIDREGKWRIRPQYVSAGDFSEGLAAVRAPGQNGRCFVDRSGKTVIPPQGLGVGGDERFSEGLVFATKYGPNDSVLQRGFIDRTGKFRITAGPDWEVVGSFRDGLCAVGIDDGSRRGKVVYIDRAGRVALRPPPGCRFIYSFPGEG